MANQTAEVKSEILTKELFISGAKFSVKGTEQTYYYYDAEKNQLLKNWKCVTAYPAWCGSVRRVVEFGFDWTCYELNKSFDATSFFSDFYLVEINQAQGEGRA